MAAAKDIVKRALLTPRNPVRSMRYRAVRHRTHVSNNTEGALGSPDVAFELLLERGFGGRRARHRSERTGVRDTSTGLRTIRIRPFGLIAITIVIASNNGSWAMNTLRHGGRSGSRWLSVALARDPSAFADRRRACSRVSEANGAVGRLLAAREDSTAAHSAGGTVGPAANWLLLGAEISGKMTQAFVVSAGAGHGTWDRARNAPTGRHAPIETHRAKALRAPAGSNVSGCSGAMPLRTGVERALGLAEAKFAFWQVHDTADAQKWTPRIGQCGK